jgi:DNA-binding CsgD family transcriptional regulator
MKKLSIYNELPGISTRYGYIESIAESTSACVYWKDKKCTYLGVNHVFAHISTMQLNDIEGKKDQDLIWRDDALCLVENDLQVIHTGAPKTFVEHHICFKERVMRSFLSHKTPLRSRQGKIIGLFGLSFMLDENQSPNLATQNIQTKPSTELTFGLSQRQIDCLYYLVKGMTLKQIAKSLNLSPRTVEHYLDSVKLKLNCTSRAELIGKAFQIPAIINKLL